VITARAFAGKKYAVLGLGRSGTSTVRSLLASGAEVVAWDESEAARSSLLPHRGRGTGAAGGGVQTSPAAAGMARSAMAAPAADHLHPSTAFGGPPPLAGEDLLSFADPLTLDLAGFAAVVVAPGIPINKHPIAAHARTHGVPLIGDIELFAQARPELPPHKVVGITGTNGKSTTTALVHHILKTAGVPSLMGGNIGLPILAQDPLPEGGVYVLELSSYQIDLTYSLDCDVAVLTNVTPDHLDRYESFEAYAASKMRIFEMQSYEHVGVALGGDTFEHQLTLDINGPGCWSLIDSTGDLEALGSAHAPALQGPHNRLNAAMAYMAVQQLSHLMKPLPVGLAGDGRQLLGAVSSFRGLSHRMERIRDRGGVLFVNDSKATNPDSTAPALAAYPYIHWIVGGRAKTDSLGPCEAHLGHVRGAYTIGEAGPMFARLLKGRVPVTQSQVLEKAVTDAASAAKEGEVVLLSPACASFDQFKDFEARGEAFRAAVEALP
jgi:UDP-N-acetylmuramoylalanine--D-glutamate ligase